MKRLVRTAAVLTTLLAAACGDPIGAVDVSGTYVLQTVGGDVVPTVLFQDATYKLEVVSGSYTLNDDMSYTSTAVFRENDGAPVEETEVGTYTVTGSTIRLQDSGGFENVTGTVSGNELTFVDLGLLIVYSK